MTETTIGSVQILEPKSLLTATSVSDSAGSIRATHLDDDAHYADPIDWENLSAENMMPTVSVIDSFGEIRSREFAAPFTAVARVGGGSGTLVDEDLVLTAWHNKAIPGTPVTFLNGTTILATSVAEVIDFAPSHNGHMDGNDVILLRLKDKVPSHIAKPMRLTDATTELLHKEAVVVGFGLVGTSTTGARGNSVFERRGGRNVIDHYDPYVNMLGVDLDDGTTRGNSYDSGSPVPLPDEAITLQGDSGGPLLVAVEGEWVVAAVTTSVSDSLGRPGAVATYTTLSPFRSPIENAGGVFIEGEIGKLPGIRVTNGNFETGAPAKDRNKRSVYGWQDGTQHGRGLTADTWHANQNLPAGSGAAVGLTAVKYNALHQKIGHKLPGTMSLDFSVDLLSFTDVPGRRTGRLKVEIFAGDQKRFIGDVDTTASLKAGERQTLTGRIDVSGADSSEELIVNLYWVGDWMALDNFTLTEVPRGIRVVNGDFESGAPASGTNKRSIQGWVGGDNHQPRIAADTWHAHNNLPAGTGAAVGARRNIHNNIKQVVGTKLPETHSLDFTVDVISFTDAGGTRQGRMIVEIFQGNQLVAIGNHRESVQLGKGETRTISGRIDVSQANNAENLVVNLLWIGDWMAYDNFTLTEVGPVQPIMTSLPANSTTSSAYPSAQSRTPFSLFSRKERNVLQSAEFRRALDQGPHAGLNPLKREIPQRSRGVAHELPTRRALTERQQKRDESTTGSQDVESILDDVLVDLFEELTF